MTAVEFGLVYIILLGFFLIVTRIISERHDSDGRGF